MTLFSVCDVAANRGGRDGEASCHLALVLALLDRGDDPLAQLEGVGVYATVCHQSG